MLHQQVTVFSTTPPKEGRGMGNNVGEKLHNTDKVFLFFQGERDSYRIPQE
jgi:hypothetical protein